MYMYMHVYTCIYACKLKYIYMYVGCRWCQCTMFSLRWRQFWAGSSCTASLLPCCRARSLPFSVLFASRSWVSTLSRLTEVLLLKSRCVFVCFRVCLCVLPPPLPVIPPPLIQCIYMHACIYAGMHWMHKRRPSRIHIHANTHAQKHAHTHTLFLCLSLTHSHTHTHTLSLSHTHTHTYAQERMRQQMEAEENEEEDDMARIEGVMMGGGLGLAIGLLLTPFCFPLFMWEIQKIHLHKYEKRPRK